MAIKLCLLSTYYLLLPKTCSMAKISLSTRRDWPTVRFITNNCVLVGVAVCRMLKETRGPMYIVSLGRGGTAPRGDGA